MTYKEVVEKLSLKYGEDLSKKDENKLTSVYGGGVFVTHWPKELKPFYMAVSDVMPDTVSRV